MSILERFGKKPIKKEDTKNKVVKHLMSRYETEIVIFFEDNTYISFEFIVGHYDEGHSLTSCIPEIKPEFALELGLVTEEQYQEYVTVQNVFQQREDDYQKRLRKQRYLDLKKEFEDVDTDDAN